MNVISLLSRRGERANVGRGLLMAGLGLVLGGSLFWVASSQQAAAQNTAPGVPVLSTMMFTDSGGKRLTRPRSIADSVCSATARTASIATAGTARGR